MLQQLLENNKIWAARKIERDPDFFRRLSRQQTPRFLWIGCSDSRVPANEIVGMDPGEIFVHRNVANQVHPVDLNCSSVLQFAIHGLKTSEIILCGHYGCSGVRAALEGNATGLSEHWLAPIQSIIDSNKSDLESCKGEEERRDRLCELNVAQQVLNLAESPVIRAAWRAGQKVNIHGWIYGLKDGLIRDLDISLFGPNR